MRKGPIVYDSLDKPNASNPNVPRPYGMDYKGLAIVIGVIATAVFIFWLSALGYTSYTCEYEPCTSRNIIFWSPFILIGLAAVLGAAWGIRNIVIFNGIERNTTIAGLKNDKEWIADALKEYAKASATANHQAVTYGDNNNTSTSTQLSSELTPAGDTSDFIPMADLLDMKNK